MQEKACGPGYRYISINNIVNYVYKISTFVIKTGVSNRAIRIPNIYVKHNMKTN